MIDHRGRAPGRDTRATGERSGASAPDGRTQVQLGQTTALDRWVRCGAMALTGDPDGPPLALATGAATQVDAALEPFGLDAGVLAERAALLRLSRNGMRSCGGASRLLAAADGWVVITLARDEDTAALAAVFEVEPTRFASSSSPCAEATEASGGLAGATPEGRLDASGWAAVAELVAARPAAEVIERFRLLAVPAGIVGEPCRPPRSERSTARARTGAAPHPRVVDLSALWAGPLAASLLHRNGAEVIKVEDTRRPDGARRGNLDFYDVLNAGKRSVALDLSSPAGRAQLDALVLSADIVITSGRARAVPRLGLDPDRFLAAGTDRVWVAITAHGWDDDRVGFGDDVAATAGLVAWHPDGRPRFAADAIADPLGGAWAAAAARDAWAAGGRWFLDASLAGIAAAAVTAATTEAARPAQPAGGGWRIGGTRVGQPRPRRADATARPLGADTAAVLAALP